MSNQLICLPVTSFYDVIILRASMWSNVTTSFFSFWGFFWYGTICCKRRTHLLPRLIDCYVNSRWKLPSTFILKIFPSFCHNSVWFVPSCKQYVVPHFLTVSVFHTTFKSIDFTLSQSISCLSVRYLRFLLLFGANFLKLEHAYSTFSQVASKWKRWLVGMAFEADFH